MDRLVGSWKMKGGPVGGDQNAMTGKFTVQWLHGDKNTGLFLQQGMKMDFDGTVVESREIIGYDPKTDKFLRTYVQTCPRSIAVPMGHSG